MFLWNMVGAVVLIPALSTFCCAPAASRLRTARVRGAGSGQPANSPLKRTFKRWNFRRVADGTRTARVRRLKRVPTPRDVACRNRACGRGDARECSTVWPLGLTPLPAAVVARGGGRVLAVVIRVEIDHRMSSLTGIEPKPTCKGVCFRGNRLNLDV